MLLSLTGGLNLESRQLGGACQVLARQDEALQNIHCRRTTTLLASWCLPGMRLGPCLAVPNEKNLRKSLAFSVGAAIEAGLPRKMAIRTIGSSAGVGEGAA